MKLVIAILSFLLFLSGLYIVASTFFIYGFATFTVFITIATFLGFLTSIFIQKIGKWILLVVSIFWLVRYFEHVSYLLLFDPASGQRWSVIIFQWSIAYVLFGLLVTKIRRADGKPFGLIQWIMVFLFFLGIGLGSFIHKPYTKEFNGIYQINVDKDSCNIILAVAPNHELTSTIGSDKIDEKVKLLGSNLRKPNEYYCPQTKVRIVISFYSVKKVSIQGFYNWELGKFVKFNNPIELYPATIEGDLNLLLPHLSVGDEFCKPPQLYIFLPCRF